MMMIQLLFLVPLIAVDYGASMKLVTRIVGGRCADQGEIPYQVSLQMQINGIDQHICGGVILDKNYVLTAAHCVSPPNGNASDMSVVAGTIDLKTPLSRHLIQSIFVHEEYIPPSLIYDIALLRLLSPLKLSSRICPVDLPKQNQAVKAGSIAEVSGFGIITVEGKEGEERLYVVDNIITNETYCEETYNRVANLTIEHSQICANHPFVQKGACMGDSGGPLTINGLLVGLVSFGLERCTSSKYPAVFTRVSSYINWINEQMEKIETECSNLF
ncbi:mite allergen Der p 3-like [Mycetomoellerius zeteki]|uniref:mite allergen Der p 3-like n=1 Tax=Mycetomoellerius zeteki TaxID=64791 RepID=UPI00084E661D|nr:PREDICTED: mite allergen Der p 3-like [Trachymyrmex zeteki]